MLIVSHAKVWQVCEAKMKPDLARGETPLCLLSTAPTDSVILITALLAAVWIRCVHTTRQTREIKLKPANPREASHVKLKVRPVWPAT